MITLTKDEVHDFLRAGKEFPDGLIVDGDMNLSGSNVEELPDNLTVNGDLFLTNNKKIRRVPNTTKINGMIFLSETNVLRLSKDLFVDSICYCKTIYTVDEYNALRKPECDKEQQKFVFSPKNILTIKKLLYIPELFQNVFYANKSGFISLIHKM